MPHSTFVAPAPMDWDETIPYEEQQTLAEIGRIIDEKYADSTQWLVSVDARWAAAKEKILYWNGHFGPLAAKKPRKKK